MKRADLSNWPGGKIHLNLEANQKLCSEYNVFGREVGCQSIEIFGFVKIRFFEIQMLAMLLDWNPKMGQF